MGTVADGRGTFGELVRRRRASAGLTQEELAERSGLSVRAISDIERGVTTRPHRSSAGLLADALGLDDSGRDELASAARSRPDEARVTRAPSVPRQLPAAARNFVGRATELETLTGLLGQAGGLDGTVVITAIGGTAGVGKTTLAVHWAHQVAERWPDGQLYVDLRGFDPSGKPLTATEAVRALLDALDVPASRIPPALGAQVGLYRSLLAGRRLLVLLDNAADEAQVRPLLPGSPECLVVVTSRRQLAGLVATEGAYLLTLDVLNSAEAAEMLTGRLGAARTAEDHVAVGEIIAGCARLPLALSIAAARAASRPGFPLSALAGELRDARARLDVLDADDAASSVRAVFSWSYQKLSDPAARMFRLLGVHPGPDIATPAAASLAAVSPGRARRLLGELARAHLIVEHSPGRFAFHDLLRSYAADRTLSCDSETERSSARHRLLDHYLHTAHSAALLLHPAREAPSLGVPRSGTSPEYLPGYESALAWFEAERHVLHAAIAQAAETGFDSHAWQIPLTLATFFDTRGYVHDWAAIQKFAVTAAEHLGNQAGQAQAHRRVGAACILLGSYAEAISHLELALDLERQRGHSRGQAAVHLDFGRVYNGQGQHRAALRHVQRAADLYQEAGYAMGHADALNAVGWSHIQLGDYERALACCRRAIALQQELGDRRGEAGTWDSLGYAYHHLGRHPDAVACYRRALGMLSGLGDRRHQAETLTHLGDTYHASGDLAAAHDVWHHALTILDDYDLDHPSAERVRAKLEIPDPSGVPPA